jgi:hypothetical protein
MGIARSNVETCTHRFVAIARLYRMLADAEERSAEHKGAERRSPNEVQQ